MSPKASLALLPLLVAMMAACESSSGNTARDPKVSPESAGVSAGQAAARPLDIKQEAMRHPKAPPPGEIPPTFEGVPGTSERSCVEVNSLLENTDRSGAIRSGEFVAGPFPHYVRSWVPYNENKLWWSPLHTRRMPGLTVRTIPLKDLGEWRTFRFSNVAYFDETASPQSETAIETRFYPSGIKLPRSGTWRLVATSGPDWGCFELTLPG